MPNAIETTEQTSYITLNECVACGGSNLEQFLNLDKQPLANNYHDGSGGGDEYPLGLNVCKDCWHTQLPVSVDPKIMFDHYIYVTGTSQTLRDYCDWFANFVTEREDITNGHLLDIACNDGTQLDSFRKLGWKTYGVDPAKNLFEIAKDKVSYLIKKTAASNPSTSDDFFEFTDKKYASLKELELIKNFIDIVVYENVHSGKDFVGYSPESNKKLPRKLQLRKQIYEKQLSLVSKINREQYSEEIRIILYNLVEGSSLIKLKMMGIKGYL